MRAFLLVCLISLATFFISCSRDGTEALNSLNEPELAASSGAVSVSKEEADAIVRNNPAYKKFVFFNSLDELLAFRVQYRLDAVFDGGDLPAVLKMEKRREQEHALQDARIYQALKKVTNEQRARSEQQFFNILDRAVETGEITEFQSVQYKLDYRQSMQKNLEWVAEYERSSKSKSSAQPTLANVADESPTIGLEQWTNWQYADLNPNDYSNEQSQGRVLFQQPTNYALRTCTDFELEMDISEYEASFISNDYAEITIENGGCNIWNYTGAPLNRKYAIILDDDLPAGREFTVNFGTPSGNDYDPEGFIWASSGWSASVDYVGTFRDGGGNPRQVPTTFHSSMYYMGGNGDLYSDGRYYILDTSVEEPYNDLFQLQELWVDINTASEYESYWYDVDGNGEPYVTVSDLMQLVYLNLYPTTVCFSSDFDQ